MTRPHRILFFFLALLLLVFSVMPYPCLKSVDLLHGKRSTLTLALRLLANQSRTYVHRSLFHTYPFSRFIFQVAHNRWSLAGEGSWLEARTSDFSAPAGA